MTPKEYFTWSRQPAQFPPGLTFAAVVKFNGALRAKIPADYGQPFSNKSASSLKAMELLAKLKLGEMVTFKIKDDDYIAIKEYHSPHRPDQGSPHVWHPGVSIFQRKKQP